MKFGTNILHVSANCCKGSQGQKSKGQGHEQNECYLGGGMHLDGVASRLTNVIIFNVLSATPTELQCACYTKCCHLCEVITVIHKNATVFFLLCTWAPRRIFLTGGQ